MSASPRPSVRTVGIVGGSGAFGRALAARLLAAELEVVIGSRDPQRGRKTAAVLAQRSRGARVSAAANRDAAGRADLAVLAVPHKAHEAVVSELAPVLAHRLVLDVTVPVSEDDPSRLDLPERSMAERTQDAVPAARVVSGFHTLSAGLLRRVGVPLEQDVLLCGGDQRAKDAVAALVRAFGARPIDCGALAAARVLEGLGAMIVALNLRYHRRHIGLRLTGLGDERRPR